MVVFVDGIPSKKDYKKFKIKTVEGQSDVDCLREIMERRIKHKEWPLPQLILVDGGKPQVNTIKKVLKENKINIEIVGIAKGKQRKKNEFINWKKGNEDLLIKVRDEAHRFAIKYQRNLRKL